MAPKISISSPLEAGTSLLDSHNLSAAITEALDYVSARLVRKRLHLTLILTQEDVSLPVASAAPSPCMPQSPRSPMFPLSPVANFFRRRTQAPSPIQEFPTPTSPIGWTSIPTTPRSPMTPGGLFSHPVNFTSLTHLRNRSLPTTPRIPPSPRQLPSPRQPPSPFLRPDYTMSQRSGSSASSCSTDSSSSANSANSAASTKCSIKLIPAIAISQKDAAILGESLAKAAHKHGVQMVVAATSANLVHRSLQQNRLIHSSEGLTVLALDRIYTLKLAIARYAYLSAAGTLSPNPRSTSDIYAALTEAVDELRLTVWAQQVAGIDKSLLLRSYDHLPISIPALRELNAAYRSATSKPSPIQGLEAPTPPPLTSAPPSTPLPEPTSRPRRWHTTKEDREKTYALLTPPSRGPMVKVMRKAKLDAAEKNRSAQLFLESTSSSQPQTHLQAARQRLQRPPLPRINTLDRQQLAEVPTPADERPSPLGLHSLPLSSQPLNSAVRNPAMKGKAAKEDFTPTTRHEWSFFTRDQEAKTAAIQIKSPIEAPHAMFPVPSPTPLPNYKTEDAENEVRKNREVFASIPRVQHEDEVSFADKKAVLRMPEPGVVLENARQTARTTLQKPLLTRLNTLELADLQRGQAHVDSPVLGKDIKRLHSFRGTGMGERRGGQAPKTPGGWEDCTPVTRNEWSFFIGEQAPRVAAVETC